MLVLERNVDDCYAGGLELDFKALFNLGLFLVDVLEVAGGRFDVSWGEDGNLLTMLASRISLSVLTNARWYFISLSLKR